MSTPGAYLASAAADHIGSHVSFDFFPGWEDPQTPSGWLHHVSRSAPGDQDQLVWLHIDDDEVLEETTGAGLGGSGLHPTRSFRVTGGPTAPSTIPGREVIPIAAHDSTVNNHLHASAAATPASHSIEETRRFYSRAIARHTRIAGMSSLRRLAPTLGGFAIVSIAGFLATLAIPNELAFALTAPFILVLAARALILTIESPAAAAHIARVLLASTNFLHDDTDRPKVTPARSDGAATA